MNAPSPSLQGGLLQGTPEPDRITMKWPKWYTWLPFAVPVGPFALIQIHKQLFPYHPTPDAHRPFVIGLIALFTVSLAFNLCWISFIRPFYIVADRSNYQTVTPTVVLKRAREFVIFMPMLLVALTVFAVLTSLAELLGRGASASRAVLIVTAALLGLTIFLCLRVRPVMKRLEDIHAQNVKRFRLCVACGYDLRGSAENAACPECGYRSPHASSAP